VPRNPVATGISWDQEKVSMFNLNVKDPEKLSKSSRRTLAEAANWLEYALNYKYQVSLVNQRHGKTQSDLELF